MISNHWFMLFVHACIGRHMTGDWGDIVEDDKVINDYELEAGGRIVSSYDLPEELEPRFGMANIMIITEADRTTTTVLWPEEY